MMTDKEFSTWEDNFYDYVKNNMKPHQALEIGMLLIIEVVHNECINVEKSRKFSVELSELIDKYTSKNGGSHED